MELTELIAALTIIIPAVIGMYNEYTKRKDTDDHGDVFMDLLERTGTTFEKVETAIPEIGPYVDEYNETLAEARKIWEAKGLTSDDIKMIDLKAKMYISLIDQAIAKYRASHG